jgi:hypothetical protein
MSAEKVLTFATVGLWPPVPVELRSDYATAHPEKQATMRQTHLVRVMRWTRSMGLALSAVLIGGLWFSGALAALGLPVGQGVAYAGDVQKLAKSFEEFRVQDMRQDLEDGISSIDAETFQLNMAINQATRAGREPDILHLQRVQ